MKKFITFEGPDFCGKTTILKKIMDEHLFKPICLETREPGSFLMPSSLECEKIRKQILFTYNSPEQEVELFAKSRLIHTKDILRHLQSNNVFCDRFIVSSLAYQGYAQDLGKDIVYEYNKEAIDLLKLNNVEINVINFSIDKDEWLNRKNIRLQKENLDKIESKKLDNKVLNFFSTKYIYEYYTSDLNTSDYVVDANKSIDNVYKDTMKIIRKIINERR